MRTALEHSAHFPLVNLYTNVEFSVDNSNSEHYQIVKISGSAGSSDKQWPENLLPALTSSYIVIELKVDKPVQHSQLKVVKELHNTKVIDGAKVVVEVDDDELADQLQKDNIVAVTTHTEAVDYIMMERLSDELAE